MKVTAGKRQSDAIKLAGYESKTKSYVKLRPGSGGEAEFARVCDRVRQGISKPGRVREGYGRGDAKVIQ